jgi:hypothetical protein
MRKLIRTALAVTALLTGLLFVLPLSPASAAPNPSGLQSYSKYFYSTTGSVSSTFACPAGSRLVGSGVGHSQVLAMAPTQNNTAVAFVAAIYTAAPYNFVYVSIQCAPASQFTDVRTVITRDHRAKPGVFSRGISTCPAGMYAFGGGGYFSDSAGKVMGAAYNNVSNTPSANGSAWTYSGIAPPKSTSLVTTTQCAPRVGLDRIVQSGTVVTRANVGVGSYADCPPGYYAISGGFYLSKPDGTEATPGNAVWTGATTHSGLKSWYASGNASVGNKVVALAQCVL